MARMPLILAEPRQLGPEARGTDLAAGAGRRAIAEGMADTAEVTARIFDAEMRMRAQAAAANAALRIDAAADDVVAGNQWEIYDVDYDEKRQKIAGEEAEEAELAPGYREVYDAEVEEYAAGVRLRVIQEQRRRALAAGQAWADQTQAKTADLEARAPDAFTKDMLRKKAAEARADSQKVGIYDEAEAEKRRIAYDTSVWSAELQKGLNEDPAGTLAQLKAGEGAFAPDRMREEDRQKAIAAAESKVNSSAAEARAAERFLIAKTKEEERIAAAQAHADFVDSALVGAATPERYAELSPYMSPSQRQWAASIVAKGGRFIPGDPDPGYYAEMMDLRAKDPQAFAFETTINPELAGNQTQELIRAQGAIRGGKPLAIESTLRATTARFSQVAAPTGWFDRESDMPSVGSKEYRELEGEFYYRVKERAEAFQAEKGRGPTATELEKEILDPVVLGFVRDYRVGVAATTGRGQPLPFIPLERRALVEGSLRDRGIKPTEANVQKFYEQLLEQGEFE